MVCCEICNKEFPFAWKLRRHLARKKPCTPTTNESSGDPNNSSKDPNNSSKDPNNSSKDPNNSYRDPNNSSRDPNNSSMNPNSSLSPCEGLNCIYCNKLFTTKKHRKRHEYICKFKDDEVMQLEKQCNVGHKMQSDTCTCKYCNKRFSRTGNLTRHLSTCETKVKYKESLEAKLKQLQPTVSNTTINNTQNANTINNNTINIQVLGNENMDHVTMKKIEKILHNVLQVKYPGDNNLYKLSAETVADVHKLIREDEANKNIVIPHERRQVALIKRNANGFVKEDIGEVLDNGFRNTSKKLCDAMKDFEGVKKTQKIHKCVESFSKKGFRGHPEMPKNCGRYIHRREDVNHAKRKFKLANMYEGNENNMSESQPESENESDEIQTHESDIAEKTIDDFTDVEDWLCN